MSETLDSIEEICKICLSSDRKMYQLNSTVINLLTSCGLSLNTNANICWECNSILMKFHKFQEKAKHASELLEEYSKTQTKPETLSSLTISECYHMEYENEEQRRIKIKEENDDLNLELGENLNLELEGDDLNLINEASDEFEDLINVEPFVKNVNPLNSKRLPMTNDDGAKYVIMQLNHEKMLELRELTLDRILGGEVKFKCDRCLVGFRTEESLNKHNRSAHFPNETRQDLCTICQCYIQRKYANLHVNSHYIAYRCVKCTHFSKNRALARKHYYNEHAFKGALVCRICRRRFEDQATLIEHKKIHNPLVCCICKKKLKNKHSMKAHMLLHAGGTPKYQCDICFKYYRGRSGLRVHKAGVHKKRKPKKAYCADCDIHFDNTYGFKKHVKESPKHIEATHRLICDKCGDIFTSKNILSQHIQKKHKDKSKYACNVCFKPFAGPKKLQDHIDYVHKKKPKPKIFECNICHRKLTTKRILANHLNAHKGVRPFKCDLCESAFTQSGTLYRHRRIVHLIKKISD